MNNNGAAPPATAAKTSPAKVAAVTDAPAAVTDEGAVKGKQLLDPKHDWPKTGGSYVRQADGKLKREG